MQRQILLFSVSEKKKTALQKICTQLCCSVTEIDRKRYGESLGSLLGICGTKRHAVNHGSSELYAAMGFPVEMLVFCGFSGDDLDLFLKLYRETGLEPVPLKAMITPHNINWSAVELFAELMEEHRRFGESR